MLRFAKKKKRTACAGAKTTNKGKYLRMLTAADSGGADRKHFRVKAKLGGISEPPIWLTQICSFYFPGRPGSPLDAGSNFGHCPATISRNENQGQQAVMGRVSLALHASCRDEDENSVSTLRAMELSPVPTRPDFVWLLGNVARGWRRLSHSFQILSILSDRVRPSSTRNGQWAHRLVPGGSSRRISAYRWRKNETKGDMVRREIWWNTVYRWEVFNEKIMYYLSWKKHFNDIFP